MMMIDYVLLFFQNEDVVLIGKLAILKNKIKFLINLSFSFSFLLNAFFKFLNY